MHPHPYHGVLIPLASELPLNPRIETLGVASGRGARVTGLL